MGIKEILKDFELKGQDVLIEELEEDKEEKPASGIILTQKQEDIIKARKARVLKVGDGHTSDFGAFIENPIEEGAIVYYKVAAKYEIEGVEFLGTDVGNIIAYKNE